MQSPESKRLIKRDGELFCWCVKHNDYFPCEDFYKRDRTSTGYDYNCMTCIKEQAKKSREKHRAIPKENEKQISDHILTRLGYDTQSDVPVHEQFLKKYHDRIRT
jgi:hypothetical protein